jgi:flagellar motor switch protein FliN/FliY
MTDQFDQQELASDLQNPFTSVPIEITVSVGKARPLIRDLVMLGNNAVLPVDKSVDDPVELFVGDKLIARGMLEEAEGSADGNLVVRLTEVLGINSGE